MERLNYGSRLDYDEDYGHDSDYDLEDEGHDVDFEDEDHGEGLWEDVGHQADYAADDSVASDFDARFGWRSTSRRRQRGKFVPPDTRAYAAPVFVRVADLQAGATSGSGEAQRTAPPPLL